MNHPFLKDPETLDRFVADWHAHRLTREAWTHGAHVGVCAYYAFDRDEAATLAIMRPGIRSFNESIGGQNTATGGYHETVTRLWVAAIAAHLRATPPASRWEAACSAVAHFDNPRDLLSRCYSFDVLADVRARAEWVPPDREQAGLSVLPSAFGDGADQPSPQSLKTEG
jgi:hypothetical protein